MIYAIQNDSGRIKLGRTNNISRRLKELKTADPTYSILYTLEVANDRKAEISLHSVFSKYYFAGELYIIDQEGLVLLEKIFNPKIKITEKECGYMKILGFRV